MPRRSKALVPRKGMLPSGRQTTVGASYFAKWSEFNALLANALRASIIGTAPMLLLKENETGKVYSLPLWTARRVVELYLAANKGDDDGGNADVQGSPQE